MPVRLPLLLAATLALTACWRGTDTAEPAKAVDPAIAAALADPIMIDPDLVSQNRGNAAIALKPFDAVPLDQPSPEATEAARAEAVRIVGGLVRSAPQAVDAAGDLPPVLTAGQLAAALPAGCSAPVKYGYGWAASLPAAVPIYPRGHVQEAAGSDACRLRAVIYSTPVAVSDVIDFYHTRTADAGFAAKHIRHGEVEVLRGSKGGAAFEVRVRSAEGVSMVELAVRD